MRQTLQEWAGAREGQGTQLSLVFTDVVGSTALAQKIGDKNWIKIISPHFREAHRLAEEHEGFVIKLIGDACMVAFKSSVSAFNFATYFYVDPGHRDLSIRAAINTGHVYIMGDDIYGMMVNMTARIQKLITGHGIMVSHSVASDLQHAFGKDATWLRMRPSPREIPDFSGQRAYWLATRAMRVEDGERMKRAQATAQQAAPPVAAAQTTTTPQSSQASKTGVRPRITPPTHEWQRLLSAERQKNNPDQKTAEIKVPLPDRPKKDPS